ncbi:hypothetical protein EP7_002688 [Isosphaeraceae bacterium EP7]
MSSLSRDLSAAVDSIDAGRLPAKVSVENGPHRVELDLVAGGPVGVSFDRLDFAAEGVNDKTPAELRGRADRVAGRLSYLMEPLAVVEHDPQGAGVVIRSQPPSQRGDVHAYYEANLRDDGHLTLGRVAFDETDRERHPVPCQLTREALDRLVDDLADVIR